LVVTLVVISLAVISLDYREGQSGPLAGLGRTALSIMEPMQAAVTNVTRPVGNFFSGLAHLPSQAREIQDLKNQLRDANAAVQSNGYVQAENTKLQGLLDLKTSLDPSAVGAVVISNGLSNTEWMITIDRGSADGIARDMPVVAGTAGAPMAVGKVVNVSDNASQVQLLIDPRSAVAGRLETSKQAGKVEGQGEGDLKMTLIEPGTQVSGNESVFTLGYCESGVSGIFPPGVLVGQVSRTLQQDSAIQEAVSVRPAVDFATLQFVLVLKTGSTCP
jgi:rod shape-determining protein MreC